MGRALADEISASSFQAGVTPRPVIPFPASQQALLPLPRELTASKNKLLASKALRFCFRATQAQTRAQGCLNWLPLASFWCWDHIGWTMCLDSYTPTTP